MGTLAQPILDIPLLYAHCELGRDIAYAGGIYEPLMIRELCGWIPHFLEVGEAYLETLSTNVGLPIVRVKIGADHLTGRSKIVHLILDIGFEILESVTS